jgi:tetratricopeptide (TPR) repeat protein
VLTLRREPGDQAGSLVAVAGEDGTTGSVVIDLGTLPGGADREMLHGLVGGTVLPDHVERSLIEAGERNPFFLEELAGWLRDSGALVPEDGGWRFDHMVPFEVPRTIETLLLSRIDRLPPATRDVLDAASILGRSFPTALLDEVRDAEADAAEWLETLAAAGLLLPADGGGTRLQFRHSLVQETAYRSLLKRRRRELHARAALAIERMAESPGPGIHALLARHRREGGDPRGALDSFRLAAAESRALFAVVEAAEHLTSALEAAAEAGLEPGGRAVRELLLERGRVRAEIGEASIAGEDFDAAARFAHEHDDLEIEARAVGERGFALAGATSFEDGLPDLRLALDLATKAGDEAERVTALGRLSLAHANLLRFDLAFDEARQAEETARSLGDAHAEARALDAMKQTALQLGDLHTLERTAAEASRTHEVRGDRWYLQFSLFEPFAVGWATGDWELATARTRAALAVNEEIGDRGNRALFVGALCEIECCAGRLGASIRHGEEAVALAEAVGHGEWTSWSEQRLGVTLLEAGATDSAIEHLRLGVAAGRAASARLHLVRSIAALARAEVGRADLAAAADFADEAVSLLEGVAVPPGRAWLFGWPAVTDAAEAMIGLGRLDRARSLVQGLLGPAEDAGWRTAVAQALLVTGLAHAAAGSRVEAKEAFLGAARETRRASMPLVELRVHAGLAVVADSREDADRARRIGAGIAESLGGDDAKRMFIDLLEGRLGARDPGVPGRGGAGG